MKILIVEDDKFFGVILKEFFSDYGIDCHIVDNSKDALEIQLEDFSAALIDMALPNNSPDEITPEESRGGFSMGVVLAKRFRKHFPDLPIILTSNYPSGILDQDDWLEENKILFWDKADGRKGLHKCLSEVGLIKDIKPSSFIVHGHDKTAILELKNYIQNTLKWKEPIVLSEQRSKGRTIIEKFEEFAYRVDYVFVLMTPDDFARGKDEEDENMRARQNVIFELGFFCGQFGRKSGQVILLYKGSIELPSDLQGIVYIDISDGIDSVGEKIRKEIKFGD